MNRFKRFIFVESDKTFHITNFTTLNATKSSFQTVPIYALHSEVWSCVWIGNSSKSKFLHKRYLEFLDSRDLPNFRLFFQKNAKNLTILQSFCKIFNLYSSRKNIWKVTVIQTSFVPHNSMQVSCAPKCLFCGFVLFLRRKGVSLNFAFNKKSYFLRNISLSASSISGTKQDILLQKSTELKMEGRKSFT